jgi:hypothetical protein
LRAHAFVLAFVGFATPRRRQLAVLHFTPLCLPFSTDRSSTPATPLAASLENCCSEVSGRTGQSRDACLTYKKTQPGATPAGPPKDEACYGLEADKDVSDASRPHSDQRVF